MTEQTWKQFFAAREYLNFVYHNGQEKKVYSIDKVTINGNPGFWVSGESLDLAIMYRGCSIMQDGKDFFLKHGNNSLHFYNKLK